MKLQEENNDSCSLEEYTMNSWADFDLLGVDGEYISFANNFCYLGTVISSDLPDYADISRQIQQASKAFGSLSAGVFCNWKHLSPKIRHHLFMTIFTNLLLRMGLQNMGSNKAAAAAASRILLQQVDPSNDWY